MSEQTTAENKKILVVDDDPHILEVYRAILTTPELYRNPAGKMQGMEDDEGVDFDFDLHFSLQGEEGFRLVEEAVSLGQPFAMACIDVRMPPGWDGIETAARIRRVDPDIEIVIVSGYSDKPLEEVVYAIGAPHKLLFLRKPFDKEELAQMALALTRKWNLTKKSREQELALRISEKRNRDLSRRLISVLEEERKKIARDLHDEFGHLLPLLQYITATIEESLPAELRDHHLEEFEKLHGVAKRIGDTCRNILHELRPDMLDRMGLIPTIKWSVNEFVVCNAEVAVDFQVLGLEKELDPDIQTVLYRTFQEGVNNIAKHAGARHVQILLTFSHPHVILTMSDDGCGFDVASVLAQSKGHGHGIGLVGMRERIESVCGDLIIRSQAGEGTMIRAVLPVS